MQNYFDIPKIFYMNNGFIDAEIKSCPLLSSLAIIINFERKKTGLGINDEHEN